MRNLQLLLLFVLPCFFACEQVQEQALFNVTSAAVTGHSTEEVAAREASEISIVLQSTDNGQSWQDISTGLPEGLTPSTFFTGDGELFLGTSKGLYRNGTTAKTANWKKEMALEQSLSTISAGVGGVIAFSRDGRFFQKLKGMGVWTPIFTNFKSQMVRSVFTASDGSVFIGCDNGLFKSADQGKTWKHVMENGWVIKMVESDGVLLCTNEGGILRSTDGGDNWNVVLNEGGVGIAVEIIKDGFAAITCCTNSETRRVRTSTDGGETWQAIDTGLPPSLSISSIQQVGDYFYCGHPKGIYRSADQGQSWDLLLPAIGEKVFNLSVSDGVLYAVLQDGGC